MTQHRANLVQVAAKRLVIYQVLSALVACLMIAFFATAKTALAFAGGVGASLVPSVLAATVLFSSRLMRQKGLARLMTFYLTEVVKIVIGVVVLLALFHFLPANKVASLVGYVIAVLVFWGASLKLALGQMEA